MINLLYDSVDYWAEHSPDKAAFTYLDHSISYRELSELSARLSGVLQAKGVRRGDRVGVLLAKSLESMVAIYGIMKAGAAFVPLDPAAAPARLGGMIDHCGVECLISHPDMQPKLNEILALTHGLTSVIGVPEAGIDSMSWGRVAAAEIAPPVRVIPQDIAYIMYTSGSTGAPKGITHTHASGLAYAHAIAALYDVQPDDRFGNHAPLHFDISTFDYFAAPLCGATTVIIPEPYMKMPASLSELMEKERITLWFSAPNALTQLLRHGVLATRDLTRLRWVIFGGEPFAPKHLRALMALWPDARFSNSYGPAEVNMCSYYHVDTPLAEDAEALPIGRMWDIAEGLIVDENDQPVPAGTQGELLVCAPTMMRGYWNAPALNARCFYTRAVSARIEDVFYRTGDIVVDKGENRMMFLGRKDRQIKLRGYRVELDEIEHVLATHPAVEEAAAYLLATSGGLEAAVTLKPTPAPTAAALAEHCRVHLPPYAIPETIRTLTAFPRTTSQKIDRRALGRRYDTA